MLDICLVILGHMFMADVLSMEQAIIIVHGITIITIRALLRGVMAFTGIHTQAGDFRSDLVMAG